MSNIFTAQIYNYYEYFVLKIYSVGMSTPFHLVRRDEGVGQKYFNIKYLLNTYHFDNS